MAPQGIRIAISYGGNMRGRFGSFLSFAQGAGFLAVALFVLLVPQSHASWSTVVSTGSATGVGVPSCAQVTSGNVVCAVRTINAAMMVNEYNGSAWSSWKTLAGSVSSNPSCTRNGQGEVVCGASAVGGGLWITTYNGSSWATPTVVSGALASAPSCAEYKAGEVLCVARGSSGGLIWTLSDDGKWSSFATISADTVSPPSCTSDQASGVVCSVYTTGGQTLVNRFHDGGWLGFLNIAGEAGGEPDCTYWKPTGQVACFAKSVQGGIYVTTFNGGSWATGSWIVGYEGIGGVAADNANCVSQSTGDLVCAAVGPNDANQLFTNVYNGSSWAGWSSRGGKWIGVPSCALLEEGKAICVAVATNNQLSSVVGP
jgi:hypothetical protein